MSDGNGPRQKLGKIMLRQKLVTPDELQELLADKRDPNARLATKAVASGKVTETGALRALSEQQGVPAIDLRQLVIATELLALIPQGIATQHLVLPISLQDDQLSLAMAEPNARHVIDEIEFVTGKQVFAYIALAEGLREVIAEAYAHSHQPFYVGPDVTPEQLERLGVQPDAALERQRSGFTSIPPPIVQPRPDGSFGSGKPPVGQPITSVPPLDPAFATDELADTGNFAVLDPSGKSSPRVLIVDDEADIRNMMGRILAAKGVDIIEATNGADALQMVRDHVPHLILLDAMLPAVHGFDVARRLRDSQRYGHIPIVMISAVYRGWRFAEDLRKSYGIAHYLEKPFKLQELRDIVLGLLAGRTPTASDPDDCSARAGQALQTGIEAFQQGDLDGAIAHLEAGLTVDPLVFRLHYHLGLLLGKRGDLFRAIQSLECAADLQPRNFPALKNLAVAYQHAGFKHKAVEMWERALASAPDDAVRASIKQQVIDLL